METPTSLIGLISVTILTVIALFRDAGFLQFLTDIRQRRSKADEELIRELQREKDVTKAFMEMVDDDELVIKYKTLRRVMKTHEGKERD